MIGALLFLGVLIAQRLGELVLAKANTARLRSRGAIEVGARHYPLIVVLHTAWIVTLVIFGWDQPVHLGWLAVFAALQVFRVWILASLGRRWTTRIIVLEEPLVRTGPFRYLRHPNYALVVAEIAVAPLVLGLTWVAVIFSGLNGLILAWRIRVEDQALAKLRD